MVADMSRRFDPKRGFMDDTPGRAGDGSSILSDARWERRVQSAFRKLNDRLRAGAVASLEQELRDADADKDEERVEAILRLMEKQENERKAKEVKDEQEA